MEGGFQSHKISPSGIRILWSFHRGDWYVSAASTISKRRGYASIAVHTGYQKMIPNLIMVVPIFFRIPPMNSFVSTSQSMTLETSFHFIRNIYED